MALIDGLPSSGRTAQPPIFMVAIRNVATDSALSLLTAAQRTLPSRPASLSRAQPPTSLSRPAWVPTQRWSACLGTAISSRSCHERPPGQRHVRARPLIHLRASPANPLQFAAMFVQSNDLFFVPKAGGIALFDAGGRAMPGNVANQVALYDAGTDVNQLPALGR